MSSSTWTPHAVASESKTCELTLWRAVEAQHVVATRALVDSLAEQEILESVLEASKPRVRPHAPASTICSTRPSAIRRRRAARASAVTMIRGLVRSGSSAHELRGDRVLALEVRDGQPRTHTARRCATHRFPGRGARQGRRSAQGAIRTRREACGATLRTTAPAMRWRGSPARQRRRSSATRQFETPSMAAAAPYSTVVPSRARAAYVNDNRGS